MSLRKGKDYIYLAWRDTETDRKYLIAQLSKNLQYEFNYGFEIHEAIKKGFKLLICFEQIDKVYKSDILFPVFSGRLPDKKRQGLEKILIKYSMKDYDEYNLLKRSGARLPIDSLEFIDPFLYNEENII